LNIGSPRPKIVLFKTRTKTRERERERERETEREINKIEIDTYLFVK
jgi:hypothetical protein